ncbi:GNAT family N-acetyltransferase [Nocardioides sp. SOB77]|uniref:GNAT family N-acetyltransferase n=1 Tax=Nocardioides oceani TaxID=3058369 RepID=A0ABT8FE54_9ACTN|nr:GNAT family N-acetyltransferase [Nocardioides oceani]MDN4172779.1 GNAT family N-acetyltransferase [Nocardioides oceani]
MLTPVHTAHLGGPDLADARALMDLAFDDFSDADWSHALGGMHALVRVGGALVAHGSLVQRRLLVGAGEEQRSWRCGYVEAVATHPDHRRRGHATAVMAALEALAPAYDVLALSASDAGAALYRGRGWVPWRGPTSVLGPSGPERTPEDDGSTYVLPGARPLDLDLDLDAPLACDWRDGDVW